MRWEKIAQRENDFLKNYLVYESFIDNFPRVFSREHPDFLTVRDGLSYIHYINKESSAKLAEHLMDQIKIDSNFINQMYTTGRKHFDALIDFSSNIGDVKNKSNQELLELVNLYFDKYKSPYPYFMITADARVFEKQKTKESEKIIEILGKLRLYGRSRFNKTHELINPLFLEIAKRFSLTVKELKFLTPSEIKLLLQGRQLDVVNLMKQREKCFFTHTHGHFVLHENSSLIIDDRIESEEIKGQGTFPAVYKGRVRLIKDQDDMQNVEDGDVIVLQMTTTDIIAKGLKKVGAIITDEGGLTCHAAVVSREFKIPALIGTGNATKILKDGDMVEVDTEKGMVRRK